jgi:cell wall assembly regulator SMI1
MKQYWVRFEKWLENNAPHLLDLLNPGASQADIDKLETLIGKKLPDDFIEFYKIHNGQQQIGCDGIIDSEFLLSIDDIINQWECWQSLLESGQFQDAGEFMTSEPDKGIKNDWWNSLWVPFTYNNSGDHICIDLDPTSDGNFGQVMHMWHDSGNRDLYANSFTEWISNYIIGLEIGKYVYEEGLGVASAEYLT